MQRTHQSIAGYTYDDADLVASPVTEDDLDLLRQTLLWDPATTAALRRLAELLEPHVDDILDTWYGYVGANAHLVASFAGADGEPDARYLDRVRDRFAQWIRDTCSRDYDARWLAYQNEIALRHHTTRKNETDHVEAAHDHIPLRYMIAFVYPITATMRGFIADAATMADDVDALHDAWFKAVVLSTTLWAQPYNPQLW